MVKGAVQHLWSSRSTIAVRYADTVGVSRTGRVKPYEYGAYGDQCQAIGELIEPQPDGCWHWIGQPSTDGYGPHRFVYQTLRGPVPRGVVLHHTCFVKHCVNPEHLEPMSNADHLALHRELKAS